MEPWLTGKLNQLHPIVAGLLYSFEHAQEELHKWTEGLTDEQLWRRSGEVAPVGFHIRHIAGSVDRLITYAAGRQLTDEQMAVLKGESEPAGPVREELFALLDRRFKNAEDIARSLDPAAFETICEIGRKRTPVPLGVLLVHISEHTQRHVGAAIVTAKLVKQ